MESLLRKERVLTDGVSPILDGASDEYAELRAARAAREPWARQRDGALAEVLRRAEVSYVTAFRKKSKGTVPI